MCPCLPYCVQVFQAVSTPLAAMVIGGLGVFIAFQQWKTARAKVKLDLFDRRIELFQAANQLIDAVEARRERIAVEAGRERIEVDDAFKDASTTLRNAQWLVGDELAQFIQTEVSDPFFFCWATAREINKMPPGSERADWLKDRDSARDRLIRARPQLQKLFAPFLSLDHLRG